MDLFDDDKIARLLRLKRYEQPPPGYFENFLQEFRRRRRDKLLRQSHWSIWVDGARDFVFPHNVRRLAYYPVGIVAAVACAAVISITLHRQSDTTQLAVRGSPVPSPPANTERELDFAPPVFNPTFDMQPALPPGTRDVPVLFPDGLRSDEVIPLKLEWKTLDDQLPLEK